MFDFELQEKDVQETTLNGKKCRQIINNDLKQMIITHLFQTFNIKMNCTNKYFIAIDPLNDLSNLKKFKHLAYINTNQQIHLIVLVTINQRKVCLLIDKQNLLFYLLKCQFSPSLYSGTIFEGEIVNNTTNNPYFLISDFLVYMNKNICTHALDKRINLLHSIMSPNNYHYDPLLDPFNIIVKDFIEYSELLSYVNDYLPTLPYKVSGLIFRPIENSNKNIIYNFNNRCLFKPLIKTPITDECQHLMINTDQYQEARFLLFETGNPDDYCLKLIGQNGQLQEYDYALINDMKTSQRFQKLLEETSETIKKNGICVLCRYISTFKKWKPISVCEGQLPNNIVNLQ